MACHVPASAHSPELGYALEYPFPTGNSGVTMDEIQALGKIRGRVREDLKLLVEALHAAKKGKMHVVIDHLERVIDSQTLVLGQTALHKSP
jgi:O-phosphoseryl-tRNA(Cys) synthetase